MADDVVLGETAEGDLERFWTRAAHQARLTLLPGYLPTSVLASLPPPAWSLGGTPVEADRLLAVLLAEEQSAVVTPLATYEAAGEALPEPGTLGIVLDGAATPRALVETVDVLVVPLTDVEVGDILDPVLPAGDPDDLMVLERLQVVFVDGVRA